LAAVEASASTHIIVIRFIGTPSTQSKADCKRENRDDLTLRAYYSGTALILQHCTGALFGAGTGHAHETLLFVILDALRFPLFNGRLDNSVWMPSAAGHQLSCRRIPHISSAIRACAERSAQDNGERYCSAH
jgi:hypothetical protein